MGYYIDPTSTTKEAFLEEHGKVITVKSALDLDYEGDSWPVCLVQNHGFAAAGICPYKEEAEAFNQPDDYRDKKWYLVLRELLKPYCDRA